MMKKIFTMAALAFLMTACSNDIDEPQAQQQPANSDGMITITAKLAPKSEAGTRAVTPGTDSNGKDIIKVKWAVDEHLAILYEVNSTKYEADARISYVDANTGIATIEFSVQSGTADDTPCTIVYPKSAAKDDHSGVKDAATLLATQDGTFNANLDVRVGAGNIIATTPNLIVTTQPAAQFAIVKFSLTDGTNAINATQFLVRDGNDNVLAAVTPASATSTLYVAIPPATSSTFRFKAATATSSYFYSKSGATLAAGKYYQSSLKLALVDMLHTPLTLEATEDGTTVTITDDSNVEYSYKVNSGTAVTTSTDATITLQAGDIVQFNSTNPALGKTLFPSDPTAYDALTIIVDKKSYVYGNVMSMVNDAGDFATDVTLADYAMPKLFSGNYSASNHIAFLADKPLMLPATTISKYCYEAMFFYCQDLTVLPSGFLPATVMQENCYAFMFDECKGLTSLPVDLLPATMLAKECYMDMFQSCNGLTTLPDDLLPATTLAQNCYEDMFHLCTGLTHAPILRATTLVDYCYDSMFSGCDKLSEVTCLATNISASYCLFNWLSSAGSKVSGPKTVYVDPSMTTKGTGSGDGQWNLSDGWTLQNYVAP